MLHKDLISIIIPCFRQAHYLPKAIQSCINQTYNNIEIIVVDDGSPDNVQEAISPYENKIKLIQQENQGLSEARNTGIKFSSGNYLIFLDADDFLGHDTVTSQLNFIKKTDDANVVVCRNKLFETITRSSAPTIIGEWPLFKQALGIHLCYFNIAPCHAFLFRRNTIIQTGYFDSQLKACEDYDFWLRVAVNGSIPIYNPKGLVFYRRHAKSMSSNVVNQYLHDAILHERLSILLDQYPHFPSGQRLEALLAFVSGVLLTAHRLHTHNLAGTPNLIRLAFKRIVDANNLVRTGNSKWNIFTKLFCLRIIFNSNLPGVKDSELKDGIVESVLDIMKLLKAPSSYFGLIIDLLSTVVTKPNDYFYEWKETINLLKGLGYRVFK